MEVIFNAVILIIVVVALVAILDGKGRSKGGRSGNNTQIRGKNGRFK